LGWETADRVGKGIAGSGDRKSRGFWVETADPQGKGITGTSNMADGGHMVLGGKPLTSGRENRGLRSEKETPF